MPATAVSLTTFAKAAQDTTPEQQILNGKFIRRELVARRALGLSMLLKAEGGGPGLRLLAATPGVQDLKEVYWRRLQSVLSRPPILSIEDEMEFAAQQAAEAIDQVGESRIAFGQGLAALQSSDHQISYREEVEISSFLDAFFTLRVGVRFLTEHYVASKDPTPGFDGIIQHKCSPVRICRTLCERAERALHDAYGASPALEVVGDEAETFTFVPSHFEFVLGELIDNAAKATVRHHLQKDDGRLTTLPPVRVIVAPSDQHVFVKIADQAGGIPRSKLRDVWSYRNQAAKRWGKGVGLGLPLARLYATYFGGSLDAVPMEGHGTDCYVVFNRNIARNVESFMRVPEAAPESEPKPIDRPRQGKWRAAIRLFDAQARNWAPPPDLGRT